MSGTSVAVEMGLFVWQNISILHPWEWEHVKLWMQNSLLHVVDVFPLMPNHPLTIIEGPPGSRQLRAATFPCGQGLKVTVQLLPQLLQVLAHEAHPVCVSVRTTGLRWLKGKKMAHISMCEPNATCSSGCFSLKVCLICVCDWQPR